MRKGRLIKEPNLTKNSIDWERFSSGRGGWITTKAYLSAHDMKTFVGLVEASDYKFSDIKFGFRTIEEAFEWADGRVDYKNVVLYNID